MSFSIGGVIFSHPPISGVDVQSITKPVLQVGHGFVIGDVIRNNAGAWTKAQADSAVNAESLGVVSEVSNADNFVVCFGGYLPGLSGLAAGSVYFLSPTVAGGVQVAEPGTAGQISKPIYQAISATEAIVYNNMRGLTK